jgi:hypothetical protein
LSSIIIIIINLYSLGNSLGSVSDASALSDIASAPQHSRSESCCQQFADAASHDGVIVASIVCSYAANGQINDD